MPKNKLCYAGGCHRPLPKGRSKYCSERCYNRINMQKKHYVKKHKAQNIPMDN